MKPILSLLVLVLSGLTVTSAATLYNFSANQAQLNGVDIFDPRQFYPVFNGTYGLAYTNITQTNLAVGSYDLFTVPASYRMALRNIYVWQTNASQATVSLSIHSGGTYYRVSGSVAIGNPTPQNVSAAVLLEPGDTLSITNNKDGTYVRMSGQLFSTNSPLKSPRLLGLPATPTLIYTVPAGKTAFDYGLGLNTSAPVIFFSNDSGAERSVNVYVVPSGESPDSGNQVIWAKPISNNSTGAQSLGILNAGTSVYVSSDAATDPQIAYVTLYEATNP